MPVHSRLQAFRDVFRERVCRHGYDRDSRCPRLFQFPYRPGRVKAVHLRHLDIHENQFIAVFHSVFHHINADPSVFRAVCRDPVHGQHGGYDLPVDVIVFRHKQVQAPQVGIIIFRLLGSGFLSHESVDPVIKGGAEERLADKSVRPCFFCPVLYIRPVVGRDQHDRNICANLGTDPPYRLGTVHPRHLPVDDDDAIIPAGSMSLRDQIESFLAAVRLIR